LIRYPPGAKADINIRRASEEKTVSLKIGAHIPWVWQKPAPAPAWGVNVTRDGRLVIAAYGDGTIRWHRLRDGQELLALFVHAIDRRWVAWTPKGYYTASAGGESLIGWHVNRGWSEAADFFAADRFRNRFYRPDVVQQVLLTLDEDKAIAEADRLANTSRQEKDILKLLPPVLEILSHKDGDRFSNPDLTIRYSARSSTGEKVDDVDVYLDDYKVTSRGFVAVPASEKDSTSLLVQLPRRNVRVTLVARSGDKASEPRSVQLTWAGAIVESKPQPRLLALLVGVSAYNQQSLKLDFAHQDAIQLSEALKAQEGKAFIKVETNVLINADSATIRKGFDWLNASARDGDLTLLLLSGHGTTRSNTFYFLPAEADPANLSATAISGHEIVGTIQGLPGGKLLLIDACRAGGGLTPVGMTQVPVDMNKLANDMGQPVGAIFFGSSGAGELSYEDSKLKAGAFTGALVEGLSGRADFNGDGKIETDEMLVWLRRRVPELTEHRQHPLRHQSAPVEYTLSIR
jgi:Caspase domain